ncbi:MAG: Ig-like domain-containing protein, partial [Acutalibacteraceae bacterium]
MKKTLAILLTFFVLVTAFTTVFAVDIASDNSNPSATADIQSSSVYKDENLTEATTADTQESLQKRYPETNFSLVNLGDVGNFTLFYNITENYTFLDYDVTLGDYVFHCFAQQTPYDLGLYVVGNNNAYTLREAYEQDLVDMNYIAPLIQAQRGVKFNFTVKKTEATTVYTQPTTAKPKETKPKENAPKISAEKANLKCGNVKTLNVNYGTVKAWSSNNRKVACVKKGKVFALNKGTATITATLTTGKKLCCKVKVTTAPELSRKAVKIKKGNTATVNLSGKASG